MNSFVAGLVLAQLANFYGGNLPIVDSTLRNYYDKAILKEAMRRQGSELPETKVKSPRPLKHEAPSASDFKPGKGRPVVDAFFAQNHMEPQHEQLMRAMIEALNKGIETNLRKNSVAAAMGIAVAQATTIVEQREIPDDALRELIANFNDQLGRSAQFQKSKPEERQALYDQLLLTTALLVTFDTLGKKDARAAEAALVSGRAVLSELGVR